MNISVLGCGRWGTFLAWYCHKIGYPVTLWGREESKHRKKLLQTRKNEFVTLPDKIVISSNLSQSIEEADLIIISIAAQQLRKFVSSIPRDLFKDKLIVLCMKGLEETSGMRLSEIVQVETASKNIAVWLGPGHVQDFVQGIPNCMLIGSSDINITKKLVSILDSELIRFYYSEDLIGMEVGAAAKNVVGIAAGMLDGIGYQSLKGALMARGAQEISRLIKQMGGNELTAYGLSHLGDYQATLFSKFSHNRMFGERFVYQEEYHKLAEGVFSANALMILSKKFRVELPICQAVHQIIKYKLNAKKVLLELFLRPLKFEFNQK